jgi:small subunit ribosomal protein S20
MSPETVPAGVDSPVGTHIGRTGRRHVSGGTVPAAPTVGSSPVPVGNQTVPQPLQANQYPPTNRDPPVANIKSQIKRNRQTVVRRARNRAVRTELKTRVKNAMQAAEAGENAPEAAAIAMSHIDRAANRGVLHRNTAARRKARLQKRVNASQG